ncbi:MAG: MFS transporter [Acidimicrobiia bacterium]|nr:MFS transporter [Acidimicrobiia bacterium]
MTRGFRIFLTVWIGQLVSVFGSTLTGFALGIYVFQQTGSVTKFSYIILAANVPGIVLAPFAGSLVDRWSRRLVMLGADTMAGLATMAAAALFFTDALTIGAIYIVSIVGSLANAFQEPAYTASVPLLVSKDQLGRANGLIQLGPAVGALAAPIAAGFILVAFGLGWVLVVDLVTFVVAVTTVAIVRIPDPERSDEDRRVSLLADIRAGFAFLWHRTGLFILMLSALVLNFLFGFFQVLIIPLFLTFSTADKAGVVYSVAGVGMIVGSVVLSVWGGPRKRIRGVIVFMVLAGLGFVTMGLRNSVLLIGAGSFVVLVAISIVNGTFQAFWQIKVPPELQGRVFSTRRMLATLATPASYLLAGPVADNIFEPAMAPGGALADTWIGDVLGVGPGRGIGLIFVLVGLGAIVTVLSMYAHPRVRHVEVELPDALPEAAAV